MGRKHEIWRSIGAAGQDEDRRHRPLDWVLKTEEPEFRPFQEARQNARRRKLMYEAAAKKYGGCKAAFPKYGLAAGKKGKEQLAYYIGVDPSILRAWVRDPQSERLSKRRPERDKID